MATRTPRPKRKEFELELAEGGGLSRRETGLLPDGTYWFEDALNVPGTLAAPVITGQAWLLELYALEAGSLAFQRGSDWVQPQTRTFGVFYAPLTLAQVSFRGVSGRLVGVAGTAPVPAGLAGKPLLFETAWNGRPTTTAQAFGLVVGGLARQAIEVNPSPSLLSLKAKGLIDDNYQLYPSIARIAARLGVSAAHLSRQFKHDYGLTPSGYLRQVRVADAPLRLARGEAIVEVSQAVGYNDLSRFYKQFRATTSTSPGACQTVMQPDKG